MAICVAERKLRPGDGERYTLSLMAMTAATNAAIY